MTTGAPGSSNRPPATGGGLAAPAPTAVRTIAFSPEQLAEVRRLQGLYPDKRGALLPVLHMAQDTFGYVPLEVQEYVAGLFEDPGASFVIGRVRRRSCSRCRRSG